MAGTSAPETNDSRGQEVSGDDLSRAANVPISERALAPAGTVSGIHLLDDGFQHRQLHRDIDILLINPSDVEDRLLPAGNLREPLRAARRASCLAIPADNPEIESAMKAWGWQGSIWRLHRKMEVPSIDGPVVAFCGIARPEQFFAGCERSGLHLAARIAFPDHHRYTPRDLDRLLNAARGSDATVFLTTEKDRARLGSLGAGFAELHGLKTAALHIEIEDLALEWLMGRLLSRLPEPHR
ncbi:MAG: tetraacyldisaccharide 4'-kinase [Terracidiphilus sp.]